MPNTTMPREYVPIQPAAPKPSSPAPSCSSSSSGQIPMTGPVQIIKSSGRNSERRREQNRKSQRAFVARRDSRLKELETKLGALTSDCIKLTQLCEEQQHSIANLKQTEVNMRELVLRERQLATMQTQSQSFPNEGWNQWSPEDDNRTYSNDSEDCLSDYLETVGSVARDGSPCGTSDIYSTYTPNSSIGAWEQDVEGVSMNLNTLSTRLGKASLDASTMGYPPANMGFDTTVDVPW